MKITGVFLLPLVLSVLGDKKDCKTSEHNIIVCKNSGLITRVIHPESRNNIILDLESNTTIGPNAFKNVNNWQLRLSFPEKGSPHMLSLQPGAFAGIEYITNLDIQYANITYSGNPWTELGGLTIFRCAFCGFTEVPTEMLKSFPNLEELILKGNAIHAVHPNAFAFLTNLKTLNLANDGHIILEPGCFNELEQLEELEIPANSFTTVPGVIDGLKKLDTLKLSGDSQPLALSDLLGILPTLTNFDLSHSHVVSLDPVIIKDHMQLRRLSFLNDNIRHIPKDVLNKLNSLVELSFIRNHIATIEPGAFSGLNLSSLTLTYDSELKVIETETFHGLTVGILQLSHCEITELKPKAFNGLKANVVTLADNKLTKIGAEDFFGLDTAILDLSQNNVTEIVSGAFKNTKVLSLWLKNNLGATANKADWGLPESVNID